MRQDRIIQASIFDLFSEHEIGRELKPAAVNFARLFPERIATAFHGHRIWRTRCRLCC